MCGWVASFGTIVSEAEMRAAADTLASRGPDGSGEHCSDPGGWPYGLGHRRLSIQDLSSSGAQPMLDTERQVAVVYNGELYNAPQLRSELERGGHRFRSDCDTEVLLRGYLEWGDSVLSRIEGIFSFALVDERARRALLVRDRLGVKPLYWSLHDGVLVAGSAPRALLELRPTLRTSVDRVAVVQFLTLLWIPHPRTPWSQINKLPPGHALTFDGTDLRTWRYWEPPSPDAGPGGRLDPVRLLEALREATRAQLLSDVPVGLLFSGGLDSTILLELMADQYGDRELDACVAGYDVSSQRFEINPDDVLYAREVARETPQVNLREVQVDADAERDLDGLALHFDDPVADPAAISLHRLCESSPHKVLLSGVGGEELWAGYPRHRSLAIANKAARMPVGLRRAALGLSPLLYGGRPGPGFGHRRNIQKLVRSVGDTRPPHYWRMMAQLTYGEAEHLVPGAAAEAFDELDAQAPRMDGVDLAGALAFDRAQFLPCLNLAYVDKASMAASVEVRVPLLDERVVEMTFAADSASFVEHGVTKVPLRSAARGVVSDRIIDRPKSGFGGPARAWFQGEPGERLGERIDAVAAAGLVDAKAARGIFRSAASGRQDAALAAWALVCLQAWHQTHVLAR